MLNEPLPAYTVNPSSLQIVKFCAEEVERQGRGAIQVWNMVEAWDYAQRQVRSRKRIETLDFVKMLGHLVEPTVNPKMSWRSFQVYVGTHTPAPPADLQAWMTSWRTSLMTLTPGEAYRNFQVIHPLADGNGRVGKIIFNWLNGTLASPEMPPNYFNCTNY